MKTTKFFFMAALALMTAACSNDDNDLTQQPAKAEGIPFSATITIDNGATTRAITENGTKLETSWAVNEKVALIHNGVSDEMTVSSVSGGVATITGTITGSPSGNDDVTIIYPSDAADGTTGNVKSNWLSAQDGTLKGTGGTSIEEKYDVRKGTGNLNATGTSLSGTVSLTNQNAIFKLTLKDIDGTGNVSATSVIISDQNGVVTTVTPASGYDKVMYVALPTSANTLKFAVTDGTTNYFNMASGLTLGTNFYQSTIKLATVGDVILSTGKCAKAGTSGAVAKIAYLGNDAETSTANIAFKNGLALALEDVSETKTWCSQTSATCLGTQYDSSTKFNDLAGIDNTDYLINHAPAGHTHAAASAARGYNGGTHPTGTSDWFLPSAGQWNKMIGAAGLSNLGLQNSATYLTSTEHDAGKAWRFLYNGNVSWGDSGKDKGRQVRACLAF